MERPGFEGGMTPGKAQVLLLLRHLRPVQHYRSKDHLVKPSNKITHCAGTRPMILH